jgi:predicted glycosyltransferase
MIVAKNIRDGRINLKNKKDKILIRKTNKNKPDLEFIDNWIMKSEITSPSNPLENLLDKKTKNISLSNEIIDRIYEIKKKFSSDELYMATRGIFHP